MSGLGLGGCVLDLLLLVLLLLLLLLWLGSGGLFLGLLNDSNGLLNNLSSGDSLLFSGLRSLSDNDLLDDSHGFSNLSGDGLSGSLLSLLLLGLVNGASGFLLLTGLALLLLALLGLFSKGVGNSDCLGSLLDWLIIGLLISGGLLLLFVLDDGFDSLFSGGLSLLLGLESLTLGFSSFALSFLLLADLGQLFTFSFARLGLSLALSSKLVLDLLALDLSGLASAVFILFLASLSVVPFELLKTLVLVVSLVVLQVMRNLARIEIEVNAQLDNVVIIKHFDVLAGVALPLIDKVHLLYGHVNDLLVRAEVVVASGSSLLPVLEATTAASASSTAEATLAATESASAAVSVLTIVVVAALVGVVAVGDDLSVSVLSILLVEATTSAASTTSASSPEERSLLVALFEVATVVVASVVAAAAVGPLLGVVLLRVFVVEARLL